MAEYNERYWDRQYKILAGPPGGVGFEISSAGLVRPLHISFSLEKADTQSSNTGSLTISNLNDEHKAILKKENCYLKLEAGYKGSIGLIFSGTVSDATEDIDGADRNITLKVVDGFESNDLIGSMSMNGKVKSLAAARYVINKMGIKSTIVTPKAEKLMNKAKYDNGFCYVGKWKDALSKICNKAGVTFSLQNGVMQIFTKEETIKPVGYELSNKTGLISIPKRISISDNMPTSKSSGSSSSSSGSSSDSSGSSSSGGTTKKGIPGYEVNYLLNPAIGVNDFVYIKSSEVTGGFRVHKISMDGDNYSGDWKCTAQVIEIGSGAA